MKILKNFGPLVLAAIFFAVAWFISQAAAVVQYDSGAAREQCEDYEDAARRHFDDLLGEEGYNLLLGNLIGGECQFTPYLGGARQAANWTPDANAFSAPSLATVLNVVAILVLVLRVTLWIGSALPENNGPEAAVV